MATMQAVKMGRPFQFVKSNGSPLAERHCLSLIRRHGVTGALRELAKEGIKTSLPTLRSVKDRYNERVPASKQIKVKMGRPVREAA